MVVGGSLRIYDSVSSPIRYRFYSRFLFFYFGKNAFAVERSLALLCTAVRVCL